jgi:tubulin epsilon
MAQSITIQVGQCGNQMASKFWALALDEHSRHNKTGQYDEALATFFRNVDPKTGAQNLKHGPIKGLRARAVMVDMEEGVLNRILRSEIAELYDPHQIVASNSGSGNNWAYGHHVYGPKFRDTISESIRKEAEYCDSLQSFISIASTGGGTGSGLGSYISQLLMDEYPNVYKFAASIVPSATDDVVTSPYNSILSLWKLSGSDCVLPIDNQALHKIVSRTLDPRTSSIRKPHTSLIESPGAPSAHDSMNSIVANLMLNMTSSMRFEGRMNVDINDIVTNLVPFPRLNYLLSSMTPLFSVRDFGANRYNFLTSIDAMFSDAYLPDTQLLTCDPRTGMYSLPNTVWLLVH